MYPRALSRFFRGVASLSGPVYAGPFRIVACPDPQGSRDEGTSPPAVSLQMESRVGKRRKKASTVSFPDSLRSCVTEKEATLSKSESKAEPHHQQIIEAYLDTHLEDYTGSCHSNFLFSLLCLSLSPLLVSQEDSQGNRVTHVALNFHYSE